MAKITSIKHPQVQFSDIRSWFDQNMKVNKIDLEDQKVYKEIYHKGAWQGIFQCVAKTTPVTLSSGDVINVEDVKVGDVVKSFDISQSQEVDMPVEAVYNNGVKPCVKMTLSNGSSLICTPDHHVFTTTSGWVTVQDLVINEDRVVVSDFKDALVVSVEKVGQLQTFDIEVSSTHNYLASGVLVHNCTGRGAQQFFKRAKPSSIVDVAALTSIFRPGPLASNVDKLWLEHEEVPYDWGHPTVNDVLKNTRGCLAEGTLITTLDNGVLPIEEIVNKDLHVKLISMNEETGKFEEDQVVTSIYSGEQETVEVDTSTGTIVLTPDHKVLTTKGWKRADELSVDDEIVSLCD